MVQLQRKQSAAIEAPNIQLMKYENHHFTFNGFENMGRYNKILGTTERYNCGTSSHCRR